MNDRKRFFCFVYICAYNYTILRTVAFIIRSPARLHASKSISISIYLYLLFYKLPSLKIPRYVLIVEEEFTAIVPNILDPSYSSYSSSSSSAMSCVKLFEN